MLNRSCTGSSDSTLVKMPHCWKSVEIQTTAEEDNERDCGGGCLDPNSFRPI